MNYFEKSVSIEKIKEEKKNRKLQLALCQMLFTHYEASVINNDSFLTLRFQKKSAHIL